MIDCVVIQWNADRTSYSVVNYNYQVSNLPIIGLDDNLEVLVKRTPFVKPNYDPRLKVLITLLGVSEDYDTEFPLNRKWEETFELQDRSLEDQKISIVEAENYANLKVFPTNKQFKYIVLMSAITYRLTSGMTLTTKEQEIADIFIAKAQKIFTNCNVCESKKTALDDGELVDLDSDWENTDPEDGLL